jgi:hypothetical protein
MIYVFIALCLLGLVASLRWQSLGYGRAFTRRQRTLIAARKGRAQVGLAIAREMPRAPKNGAEPGALHTPAHGVPIAPE